jgi:hypothetical protein
MEATIRLYVQRINHGQSIVWLGSEAEETSPRRMIASNEVRNVVQRLCTSEVFDAFYKDWHIKLGAVAVAALDMPNLQDVAKELQLA